MNKFYNILKYQNFQICKILTKPHEKLLLNVINFGRSYI
jgi:hypothetical protein